MKGKFKHLLLSVVGTAWLCIEIGQFFEARAGLTSNSLFWPFWITAVIAVALGAVVLDLVRS